MQLFSLTFFISVEGPVPPNPCGYSHSMKHSGRNDRGRRWEEEDKTNRANKMEQPTDCNCSETKKSKYILHIQVKKQKQNPSHGL